MENLRRTGKENHLGLHSDQRIAKNKYNYLYQWENKEEFDFLRVTETVPPAHIVVVKSNSALVKFPHDEELLIAIGATAP